EAGPTHAEQHTIAPAGLAHLGGERLELPEALVHAADYVEPPQTVVDHRRMGAVPRLPQVRVAVPDARRDVAGACRVERDLRRSGVDALTFAVAGSEPVDLFGDAADQLVVRVGELFDAVVEQLLRHRIHVDAGFGKLLHHPVRARIVGLDGVAGHHPVVLECLDGRWWHRVHGVGTDQGLGVDDVSIVGVLGTGARPERSLNVRTGRAQGREPRVTETALEEL